MNKTTSTFSSGPLRKNRSKLELALRIFLVTFVFLLFVAGAGYLWFRSAAQAALPQLDGSIDLAGLSAPVSVLRDAQGVPHIRAANMADLMMAQGYVTAQDRLWQMDTMRRYGAGELSAALGSSFVDLDKRQRTLGLREVAERAVQNLSPQDREFFENYAKGVNAYVADHQHSLPLEFRIARYFPRAWTPTDSFLVGAAMAEGLNHYTYAHELGREKVLAKLGPELTSDLYINSSFRDIPPGSDTDEIKDEPESAPESQRQASDDKRPAKQDRTKAPARRARRRRRASLLDLLPTLAERLSQELGILPQPDEVAAAFRGAVAAGSNNWVLSGEHTASGKPLLANDMHLNHQLPNVWYEAQLSSGDFDVAGVTLPGVPFVVAGHNQRIAWGFTNVGPDVEDIYIENFNESGEYQTPQGWRTPEVRHEIIRVKNGRDVALDVIVTRHGPLITPPLITPREKDDKRKLALKWVIYDSKALTFPFFEINSAKNWQEFRAAFSKFGTPSQNIVYADVDGHIGYQATGMIPIRASGDGSLPVSGGDDVHEWTGYIPYEQLPSVYDPPSGIIATANARITRDASPLEIATEWGEPHRTERIYRVLRQPRKFTPADMLALQTDVYSETDRYIAERLVYTVEHQLNASERARHAVDLLRQWDGKLLADSAAATIAEVSRQKIAKMMLEAKLGADVKDYAWFRQPVWLETALVMQQERWLPSQFKSYDELLTAALEEALKDAPRNLVSWKFGERFPVESRHDLFGKIPLLRRISGPGVLPQSGNGQTVKQVGRNFGPSDRMTVDLSNLDASTLNIVNGQSGHLFSQHYNDQWQAWYTGTTFALPFSVDAVQKANVNELTLTPQK